MSRQRNRAPPPAQAVATGSLSLKAAIVVSDPTRSIGVRCRSGQLQVIAVWRVIGQYAPHVRRVRAVAHRGAAYEELGVTFGIIPDSVLIDMTNQLAKLPWVLDVWFYP
jgi:hypothetical protein